MKRFTLVAAAALAFVITAVGTARAGPTAIAVVRDPGCGCCMRVAHLKKAGFQTTQSSSMAR